MQFLSKSLPAEQWDSFQASLGQFPPRCVRLRPERSADQLPFAATALQWNTRGHLLLDSQLRPSQFLEYAGGDYYIQEAGSLLAVSLAEIKPDDVVCDLCAAPGGKASAMLEDITGSGLIVANEVIGSRVSVLKYNLARTGNPRFVVTNQDSSDLSASMHEQFDVLMVDAPCSGQTLTIKNKRGENAFDSRHVEHAAARQNRILDDAIRMLKVGGRLIYSTCTFADQENEDQLQRLLDLFPQALKMAPMERLADYASPLLEGCYRLWPHRHPTAGAFAARLIKLDSLPKQSPQESAKKRASKESKLRKQSSRTTPESLLDPFGTMALTKLLALGDDVFGIHASSLEKSRNLFESAGLPISGLPKLLSVTKNVVIPNHDLALMSGQHFVQSNSLDLSNELAKQAISGASIENRASKEAATTINAEATQASKYCVALWQGRPLGWLKAAGNRWNNLIPAVARLSIGGHP